EIATGTEHLARVLNPACIDLTNVFRRRILSSAFFCLARASVLPGPPLVWQEVQYDFGIGNAEIQRVSSGPIISAWGAGIRRYPGRSERHDRPAASPYCTLRRSG